MLVFWYSKSQKLYRKSIFHYILPSWSTFSTNKIIHLFILKSQWVFCKLPCLRLSLAGELSAALECVCSTWGQGQAWGLVLEGHQFAWEAAVQPRLFPGNSSETVPHLLLLVETLIKSNVTLLIMKCLTYANSNKLQNNKTYNINK